MNITVLVIIGVIGFVVVILLVWSLCAIAGDADRRLGLK